MGRKRASNPHLPRFVYWKNGQYRYLAQSKDEKEILEKSWYPLGKTEAELWRSYPIMQQKLGLGGGMMLVFDRYESEVVPTKSARTQQDNLKHLTILRRAFGKFEPGNILRRHGIEYLETRGKEARTQAKQEFSLLRHVMTKTADWGHVKANPLLGIQVNAILKIRIRERTPELWELLAVKKHGTDFIKLWIDFKYQTGLNQCDILALPVPRFDLEGIPVKRSKTNKRGLIEWTDDLKDTVRGFLALNKVQGKTLICDNRGRPLQAHTFWQRWRKAVLKAIERGDLVESFTENDIRSRYAVDSEEIYGLDASKQLLHENANTKKHYISKKVTKIQPLGSVK